MFTRENAEVIHLKIYGFVVFIHVPKEKRTKLDPFGKKGIFVRYNDQSKSYRVDIPGCCHIEISKDVIFDEDATFRKSRKKYVDEYQEQEHDVPRVEETCKILVCNVEEE